ncbi:MAG: purine-nucleoside phosphorylase [Spirochaetia bacterium]
MSIHIGAEPGAVAETVLLPGDPLRARYVAEHFLDDAVCYNEVRGMLGFTGTYGGKRVSVQGTGMGQPSMSIYVTELLRDFGAKQVIRIGSCGALHEHISLHDLVIAMAASTDSNMNRQRFGQVDYASCADFSLLERCVNAARERNLGIHVGNVFSSDAFYLPDPDAWKAWADFGVLAVEMETALLYTIAAGFGAKALSILTVSDNVVTDASLSSEQRERSFSDMVALALSLA